jgi:thiamine transporter ThiT
MVVRSVAWGGLTLGVVLALVPLAFAGVHWWTMAAFFGLMALFYLLSANLANSVGDAIGYAWGQSMLRKSWTRFVAARGGAANQQHAQ